MDQASDSGASSISERTSKYPMRSNRRYPKELVQDNLIMDNNDYHTGTYRNHDYDPEQDTIYGIRVDKVLKTTYHVPRSYKEASELPEWQSSMDKHTQIMVDKKVSNP